MADEYRGDFAMLNPYPTLRDEDGVYHCPLPIVKRSGWDLPLERTKALCGEELHLKWTFYCSLPDHDGTDAVIEGKDVHGWALWDSWEVVCGNGHRIATSADGDGGDDAQPFDGRFFFGGLREVSGGS